MNIKRRTIKRTLSGKKLWFRRRYNRVGRLNIAVFSEARCRASSLVATIWADHLFDQDGNFFYESL